MQTKNPALHHTPPCGGTRRQCAICSNGISLSVARKLLHNIVPARSFEHEPGNSSVSLSSFVLAAQATEGTFDVILLHHKTGFLTCCFRTQFSAERIQVEFAFLKVWARLQLAPAEACVLAMLENPLRGMETYQILLQLIYLLSASKCFGLYDGRP